MLPEDDTIVSKHVRGVIICGIIVHLLVTVQNKKKITAPISCAPQIKE